MNEYKIDGKTYKVTTKLVDNPLSKAQLIKLIALYISRELRQEYASNNAPERTKNPNINEF